MPIRHGARRIALGLTATLSVGSAFAADLSLSSDKTPWNVGMIGVADAASKASGLILVLCNFFSGISREVDEAARIEGASEWRVFVSMIIPNASGPLIALFLLQFTFIWNNLLFSSILANVIEARSTLGPNVVITATLISSVPTVLFFVALRKYFMAGLQLGTK